MVKSAETLVHYDSRFFREKRGIDVRLEHEVVAILPTRKSVVVKNLDGGREEEHPYGRLVIATGARPVIPPLEGVDLNGVFVLRSVTDGVAIVDFLRAQAPRRALILGGGYIGMETAESLAGKGLDVTIVERFPHILANFSDEIREIVEEELDEKGVKLITSRAVARFVGGSGRVTGAELDDGTFIPTEIVILAVGIRPNSRIAREAGIETGRAGAINVNRRMETSTGDIYAAGDCAVAYHVVLGKPVYIPLGTTANKQGRIAGENAAGGEAVFGGIAGTSAFKIFGLEVARTGLTAREAGEEGFDIVESAIEQPSRAGYYPGGGPIRVKLVADPKTRRLLGAEMVGRDGVAKRIDVFAAALHGDMTVDDVAGFDLSYAPPFSPVWDPVLIAASAIGKKIPEESGRIRG